MMKKGRNVLFCAFILSAVMSLSVFCGIYALKTYAKEEWGSVSIESAYDFGSVFKVPQREVTIGGERVTATHTITYPDGKTTTEKSITLNEMGDYRLNYYAEKSGKQYGDSIAFTVKSVAYKVSDKSSSVTYGRYDKLGANSEGLIVRLASKDTLEFTQLLDVGKFTSSDEIVKGFITPDVRGAYDFTKLIFTLTDSGDDSVFLRFFITKYPTTNSLLSVMFVSAGGNGQDMVGYENSEPGKNPHVNDDLGQYIFGSFVAMDEKGGEVAPDKTKFTLSYDATTLEVKAQNRFVSDLDDPKYYSRELWHGFPSGKARLSVSADGYNSDTANFVLTNVAGILQSDLKNNTFTDNNGPVITVKNAYSVMPQAEKGRCYPVPDAVAYDEYSGDCEVTARVFFNYGKNEQTEVGISNGEFKADKLGYYVIEYSAKDAFGNQTKEALYVRTVLKTDDVVLELPNNKPESVTLGERVYFEMPVVSGGSGDVKVKITATLGNDIVEIRDGSFIFEEQGQYTITYTATDYIGKYGSDSYTINATAGNVPVFADDILIPKIFISGSEYVIPQYYANDYTSGKLERKLCSVKVADATGEKTYVSGAKFIPTVNNNGEKVSLTYICGNAQKTVEIPAIIARYDEGRVNLSNYLYGDAFITTRDINNKVYSEGVAVVSENITESIGWTFANALVTADVNFTIQTISGQTDFSAIEVILTDSLNSLYTVRVAFEINKDVITATHGNESITISSKFIGEKVKFAYAGNKLSVSIIDKTYSITIKEYENGGSFDGFPSGKVFVGANTLNNGNNSRYLLTDVCGRMLSYRNKDGSAPNISVEGNLGGRYNKGDIYIVKSAIFGDVFAPNSECTVTVYAPDGTIVSDVNGVKLENVATDSRYAIKLSNYGQYRIVYRSFEIDWVGNEAGEFFDSVYVPDEDAPIIEFVDGGVNDAIVGEVIVMPKFTVKDNVSASDKITVKKFVVNPNGRIIALNDDSDSITTKTKGTYKFIVCAIDEEGNMRTSEYVVNVR